MTEAPALSEFPFTSHFVEIDGHQIHYLDEGQGDPILFLHGNPTSSYLWRNILPYLVTQGRCLAPDLIGMGKSDQPDLNYSFFDHAHYIEAFIEKLNLTHITLVLHDWGSALGLNYAQKHEAHIKALCLMEFIRPTTWDEWQEPARSLFQAFRQPEVGWDLIVNQNAFVEQVLPHSIVRQLSETEMNQYRAPFVNAAHRKPLWQFPNHLPISGQPENMVEIVERYHEWLLQTDLPKLLFWATPGALIPEEKAMWYQRHLQRVKAVRIGAGIHYLQEDNPHLIGKELSTWYTSLHG
ncbi:haloalkane dehalogenase [Leptolyngbya sp. NK1-12]|uniref:Haloalkane dehalogenase n=1 Tax=Leptolyngbya sp. NK1-12 TaxID=2547451 RepID=A0AA96WI69_9CYAN|nr:haloalkane dehalogenase [Leptolyngbya sp. NK1-12]WNZ25783.1 haloalkane dehalogenase [Leptolyngbya sp. NK1-12]